MKQKQLSKLLILVFLLVLAPGCSVFGFLDRVTPSEAPGPPEDGELAKVTWVYDGDTVEVEMRGRTYKVRYIGVDTPEIDQPYYEEASKANFDMVKNQNVLLVRDVSDTDQYDRLLRYVYLTDGTFANAELLRGGYGRTINIKPDVANERYFEELQNEARQAGRGLWGLEENAALPAGCVTCSKNAHDCGDFSSQRQAQACFEFCMDQVGEDVHHLDGGGDGVVCESLR